MGFLKMIKCNLKQKLCNGRESSNIFFALPSCLPSLLLRPDEVFFSYLIVFKHIWGIGINVPVLEECLCGPELKLQLVVLVAEVLVLGGEVQDLEKRKK